MQVAVRGCRNACSLPTPYHAMCTNSQLTNDQLALLLQYANAHAWYKNLDKLIHYANADGRLNVFYSRCCPVYALKEAAPF